jgi:hypothetical protein
VSIDAVISQMQALAGELKQARDARLAFHATYLRTTQAVARALADGAFLDAGWVERWDVVFARLYLDALAASQRGEQVPGPWAVAFATAADQPGSPPLRLVLLGMNAHINYDLPQALLAVISDEEFGDPEVLARREADHRRIDDVLSARVRAEDEELKRAQTARSLQDRAMQPLNRMGTRRFLAESRAKVWANAVILSQARQQGPAEYTRRLAELELLSRARVADLQRPGPVILRLATGGFGVRLSTPEDAAAASVAGTGKDGAAKTGPVKTGPVKTGPVKTGPVKNGPVKNGPVKNGTAKGAAARIAAGLRGAARGGAARGGAARGGAAGGAAGRVLQRVPRESAGARLGTRGPGGPRSFDPVRVGTMECEVWVAYYRREWARFLWLSVLLVRHAFGMDWIRTVHGAWLVLRANQLWAPASNDPDGARRCMTRFYALLRLSYGEPADPAGAAGREVDWWAAHRAHQKGEDGDAGPLVDSLSTLYAYVYRVDQAAVRMAASQRAEAMDISDKWAAAGCDPASPMLPAERAALVRSYAALLAAVHR